MSINLANAFSQAAITITIFTADSKYKLILVVVTKFIDPSPDYFRYFSLLFSHLEV